jgi:hypothetical protein
MYWLVSDEQGKVDYAREPSQAHRNRHVGRKYKVNVGDSVMSTNPAFAYLVRKGVIAGDIAKTRKDISLATIGFLVWMVRNLFQKKRTILHSLL